MIIKNVSTQVASTVSATEWANIQKNPLLTNTFIVVSEDKKIKESELPLLEKVTNEVEKEKKEEKTK